MFQPRKIESHINWLDDTDVKIYTISYHHKLVDQSKYLARLKTVKSSKNINWTKTPAFTIFHDGENYEYLVLVWWANGNEMFTSVSVKVNEQWLEDSTQYSFCLYDLEIMWQERNIFIQTMDCEQPSLKSYRSSR